MPTIHKGECIEGMGVYIITPFSLFAILPPSQLSPFTYQLTDVRLVCESTMAGKMPALHGKHFVFV